MQSSADCISEGPFDGYLGERLSGSAFFSMQSNIYHL